MRDFFSPKCSLIMDKQILDSQSVERSIVRIAHEILEKNKGTENLALVGIHTRGVVLARRLQEAIEKITQFRVPIGTLDINLYRDDLTLVSEQPIIHRTEIDFNLENQIVILIDDVLYTGRTIRAALDALLDFGRPKRIELAVLIDRGHRELPIRADFVGKNIPTSETENVHVKLLEVDGVDEVIVSGE